MWDRKRRVWIFTRLNRRSDLDLMPIISIFFGIVIRMYFGDHSPPHFHAEHQGQKATFNFRGDLLTGNISSRTARRLIRDWALTHRFELMVNWRNVEQGRPLNRIEPLD